MSLGVGKVHLLETLIVVSQVWSKRSPAAQAVLTSTPFRSDKNADEEAQNLGARLS